MLICVTATYFMVIYILMTFQVLFVDKDHRTIQSKYNLPVLSPVTFSRYSFRREWGSNFWPMATLVTRERALESTPCLWKMLCHCQWSYRILVLYALRCWTVCLNRFFTRTPKGCRRWKCQNPDASASLRHVFGMFGNPSTTLRRFSWTLRDPSWMFRHEKSFGIEILKVLKFGRRRSASA